MNLTIKAERICDGCGKNGNVILKVDKIESGLMFLDWNSYNDLPEGWVHPHEWNDNKLKSANHYYMINARHIFCDKPCMYKYYGAE